MRTGSCLRSPLDCLLYVFILRLAFFVDLSLYASFGFYIVDRNSQMVFSDAHFLCHLFSLQFILNCDSACRWLKGWADFSRVFSFLVFSPPAVSCCSISGHSRIAVCVASGSLLCSIPFCLSALYNLMLATEKLTIPVVLLLAPSDCDERETPPTTSGQ